MGNDMTIRKQTGIASYIGNPAVKANIEGIVGKENATRFVSSVVSAVQTNKALAECTNTSILSAALLGQALNLTPSPQLGMFYMVPYDNKGTKEATFQLGYKGYIQLAIRSGQYKKIVASVVKQGEMKSYNPITEEFVLSPLPESERNSLPTEGYYAMFELVNGFTKELYWPKERMLHHADRYSKAFSLNATRGRNAKVSYADYEAGKVPESDMWKYSSFWYKDFDGMALKTILRQLISKWGIMSIDMEKAYTSDMGVIREDGAVDYVDGVFDIDPRETAAQDIEENANAEEFVDAVPLDENGEPLFK